MTAKEGEYKGKPTLALAEESDRFPFSFGLTKAKRILKYHNEIKAFVAKHDVPTTTKIKVPDF